MSCWIVRYLGCHYGWHGSIMAPDHPKMILGVHRERIHESKVSLDGFMIRISQSSHPSLECLIVAFVIAGFASSGCYSSAKIRIQLVKSYQYDLLLLPLIFVVGDLTEVWILQGIYPLKDEWVFGCSLKTRLADQTKTQQLKWLWSKDSMNSTINQRVVEQTQEMNFKLEGSGGSTLDDTLRKQYYQVLMSNTLFYFRIVRT